MSKVGWPAQQKAVRAVRAEQTSLSTPGVRSLRAGELWAGALGAVHHTRRPPRCCSSPGFPPLL
jgi:hypothetical protein